MNKITKIRVWLTCSLERTNERTNARPPRNGELNEIIYFTPIWNKFKLFSFLLCSFLPSVCASRLNFQLYHRRCRLHQPTDYRTWNESSRHGGGFIKGVREDNAGRAGNYRSPDHLLAFLCIRTVQLESECARRDTQTRDQERRSRDGELLQ